jgi:hypothetical protein
VVYAVSAHALEIIVLSTVKPAAAAAEDERERVSLIMKKNALRRGSAAVMRAVQLEKQSWRAKQGAEDVSSPVSASLLGHVRTLLERRKFICT